MDEALSFFVSAASGTLRLSTPLILCAMGGAFSENAGVVDIGLEGKMLAAAFAAAATTAACGLPLVGLLAGILAACAMSLVHGLACITYRGDQVVSGVALNILASGLTVVLAIAWFHMGGQTPSLSGQERFLPIVLPGSETLGATPVLGPLYAHALGGQSILVYVALASVFLTHWVLKKTRFGLRLRSCGEEPQAALAAGVSVIGLRYRAVLICGVLTGVAGGFLSMAQNAGFNRDMTAGTGYIALAALIFGKWKPLGAFAAALLFGFLDTLSIRLQGTPVLGFVAPVELIQAMPYALTVLLLAGFIGRSVPPKADGAPLPKT